jgi:hypothetical protein
VCSRHVPYVSGGVHDFVEVVYSELCGVGFEGGEVLSWDCVSRDVERAAMRDVVVLFSSCQCLLKVREVLSSTPRTR